MSTTRRNFIKSLGIGFASLILAQCSSREDGTTPTRKPDHSPKGRVLFCWLSLGDLTEKTQLDFELAEALRSELTSDHRAALDDSVSSGELNPAAADQVQIAFQEATHHIWRSNAPITCYEPVLVN